MPIIIELQDKIASTIVRSIKAIAEAAGATEGSLDTLQNRLATIGQRSDTAPKVEGLNKLKQATDQVTKSQEALGVSVEQTVSTQKKAETQVVATSQKTLQYEAALKRTGIAEHDLAIANQIVAQETAKAAQEANKAQVIYQKLDNEIQRGAELSRSAAESEVRDEERHKQAIIATGLAQDKRNTFQEASNDRRKAAQEAFTALEQKTATATTQSGIASQKLITATNTATASYDRATQATITRDAALAALNSKLIANAQAEKKASDAGAQIRPAKDIDFQPQRSRLDNQVQQAQEQVSFQREQNEARLSNKSATLGQILAEQKLGVAVTQVATTFQVLTQEVSKAEQELVKLETTQAQLINEVTRGSEIERASAAAAARDEERHKRAVIATGAELDRRNNVQKQAGVIAENLATAQERTEAVREAAADRKKIAAETLAAAEKRTEVATTATFIATQRLTSATNAAAASFNNASSAAINEENNLAKLNITLANQAIAQKAAIDAGGIPRVVVSQDFQPQRNALSTNVQTVQQTLSLEQQLANYRIQNEGATLSEIRAENQLYSAMSQGLIVRQRLAKGESDVAISRSRATEAAIGEAEAVARLNIVQAELAIAVQNATKGGTGVSPILSSSASFDAQRAAVDLAVKAKQQLLITDQALTLQEITLGQTTLENVQGETSLAQAVGQTAQAVQQVLQGEIALVSARSQAIVGAISQQQALTQLNITQTQLAESLKRAVDAGAAPKLSTAEDFARDRQAVHKVSEEARENAKAREAMTFQQIKNGEVTEADIRLQLRIAQALAQTAKAANAAAHEELDLAIKRNIAAQQDVKTQADKLNLERLKTGSSGASKSIQDLTESLSLNAGTAREFIVITRELLTGSTTLLGGSILVLLNRLGAAGPIINALLFPARKLIEVLSTTEVKAARAAEALAKIKAAEEAAAALAALGTAAVTTEISVAALLGVTAGLVAAIAAVGIPLYARNEQFKQFQSTLFLTNDALGLTQKAFNKLAEEIASTTPNLSVREATNSLTELARSGKFNAEVLKDLTADIGKYSLITGKTVEETTKEFIQAFGGGSDAILRFNQENGHFLTAANQAYITAHTSFIDTAEVQKRAIGDFTTHTVKYKEQVESVTTLFGSFTKSVSDSFQFLVNYDLSPFIKWFTDIADKLTPLIQLFKDLAAGVRDIYFPEEPGDVPGSVSPSNSKAGKNFNAETTRSNKVVPQGSLALEYEIQQQSLKLRGLQVPAPGDTNVRAIKSTTEAVNQLDTAVAKLGQTSVEAKAPSLIGENGQKAIFTTTEALNRAKDANADLQKDLLHSRQDNGTGISFLRAEKYKELDAKLEASRKLHEVDPTSLVLTEAQIQSEKEEIDRQTTIRLSERQKADAKYSQYIADAKKKLEGEIASYKLLSPEQKEKDALDKILNNAPLVTEDGKRFRSRVDEKHEKELEELNHTLFQEKDIYVALAELDKQRAQPLREIANFEKGQDIVLKNRPELLDAYIQMIGKLKEKQADLEDPLRETNIQREHEAKLLRLSGNELAIQTQLLRDEDTLRKGGITGLDLLIQKLEDELVVRKEISDQQVAAARRSFEPTAQREQNKADFKGLEEATPFIGTENAVVQFGKLQTAKENLDIQFNDISPFQAFITGLDQATRKAETTNQSLTKSAVAFGQGTIKGFGDAAAQALVTGKSFSESFREIVVNLVTQLTSTLIQLELQALLTGKSIQALSAAGSGGGGGGGGLLSIIGTIAGAYFGASSGGGYVGGQANLIYEGDTGLSYNLPGRAGGGYAGDMPVDSIAGVHHGREFVVHASATARNRAALESMNAGVPYQGEGSTRREHRDDIPWVIENRTTGRIDKVTTKLSANEKRILFEEFTDQWADSKSPMSQKFERAYRGPTRNR